MQNKKSKIKTKIKNRFAKNKGRLPLIGVKSFCLSKIFVRVEYFPRESVYAILSLSFSRVPSPQMRRFLV